MKITGMDKTTKNVIIEMGLKDLETLYGLVMPLSQNPIFATKVPLLKVISDEIERFIKNKQSRHSRSN